MKKRKQNVSRKQDRQPTAWKKKIKKGNRKKKSDHGIYLVVKDPITNCINIYLRKLFSIKTVQLKFTAILFTE